MKKYIQPTIQIIVEDYDDILCTGSIAINSNVVVDTSDNTKIDVSTTDPLPGGTDILYSKKSWDCWDDEEEDF